MGVLFATEILLADAIFFTAFLACGRKEWTDTFPSYLLSPWTGQKRSLSSHRCSERNAELRLMCCPLIMQVFALLQLLKYLHKYFLAKRAFILETFPWLWRLLLASCLLNRGGKNGKCFSSSFSPVGPLVLSWRNPWGQASVKMVQESKKHASKWEKANLLASWLQEDDHLVET